MRFLILVLFVFMSFSGFSQQDPQFGQYMMNPFIWNPSYPAAKQETSFSFHHRTQWLGYTPTSGPGINPPSTQLLTITTPIRKLNSGLGLGVLNDQIGPLKNQNLHLAYSYFVPVGKGKIAAGIGAGVQFISINTDLWRAENPSDPTLISGGTLNQMKPTFRLGLSYYTDNFYLGLASNHISSPFYNFGSEGQKSQLQRHYYLQTHYKIMLSDYLFLQPGALLKNVSDINSLEISNLILYRNFWLGLSFRSGDAMIFLAGLELLEDKSLKIGYNIDLTVINAQAKSASSHEIFISYNLSSILDNKKPIIRSPRFRF